MAKDDIFEGSTKDLAKLLGITTRTVQKLVGKQVFRRIRRGIYDLRECAKAFYEYEMTADPENREGPVDLNIRRVLPTAVLADLCGLSPRRIQMLTSEGVLRRVGDGYVESEALQSYHEYLRGNAKSNQGDIDQENLRLTRAKADKAEIAVEILMGETAHIETVMQIWGDLITIYRSRMLGLPNKLAATLAQKDDPAEIQVLVMEEVRDALEDLASVNTDDIVEKALPEDLDDDSSTAEPDGVGVGG